MSTSSQSKRTETEAQADQEARRKCHDARELEKAGDYQGARAVLAGLWTVIGEQPRIANLQTRTQGEVLQRVGALAGWLGSSQQIPGAQAFAKDLIGESIRQFEALGDSESVAEAQTELAICYWREGALDEARVCFSEALKRALTAANRLRILVNSTVVETSANRLREALALLDQAGPLLDQVTEHAIKGSYHMERAIVLKRLGGAENLDRALIENTAASVHFERAKQHRYFASVENNIGFVLLELGRYDEAVQHLDKARRTLIELRDVRGVAQVNETRARVFLAQGRYVEAEKTAFTAASALEEGGEQSHLAEALVTQGIAQARMGQPQQALSTLKRAAALADTAGDPESAGRTFLTILEELEASCSTAETLEFYHRADERLGNELDPHTTNRLRAAIRLVLAKTNVSSGDDLMMGGSMEQELLRFEGELIKRALNQTRGSVTRAARLLGVTHQGLCYMLNSRHKNLMSVRLPVRRRRKSIIKKR